ncbi:hypothetical protein [Xanthomonas campestris]|uniref:hypothetical protein n=1 Tax=Xanthomonas campestris TaxID=339 RepID=UPI0011AF129C|nr:hypothetical protein [Xanthomonas campestris]
MRSNKTAEWKRQAAARAKGRRTLRRRLIRWQQRSLWLEEMERIHRVAPRRPLPSSHDDKPKKAVRTITPPPVLDLEENYSATIQLLKDIRLATRVLDAKFMVDLTPLRQISPAAAILMVAECDRWREKTKSKWLRSVAAHDWDPSVRRRLKEMGFFDVLGMPGVPEDPYVDGEDRYLPFLTGSRNVGAPAQELRAGIEGLGLTIVDSSALYDGLVEAMTNVSQHAYKNQGLAEGEPRRWWISASVNTSLNKMTVMVLDHGAGIARTLPRSSKWERLRQNVDVSLLKDDAKILEAAFSPEGGNRSQTGEEFRGKGLRENVKGYIEAHNSRGHLHVIANRGRYRFSRDSATEMDTERTAGLELAFNGTFIEWVIEDYGQRRDQND